MGFGFITDKLWRYKGAKIRPKMEHMIRNIVLWLFFVPFGISMVLFWKNTVLRGWDVTVGAFQDLHFVLLSTIVSVAIPIALMTLLYFIFYDRFRRMVHKQKIAGMIISKGYCDKVQYEKYNMLTEKTKMVEGYAYFPRFYYYVKDCYMYIRIALDMKKYQEQFLDMGKVFENGLFCDLQDVEMEDGYICYKFLFDVASHRIGIENVEPQNGAVQLMKTQRWEFDSLPHALIVGGTGGGKTYTIFTLIKAFLGIGEVYICDPKNSDLADLSAVLPNVYSKKDGMMMVTRKFYEAMMKRVDDMKKMPNYKTGGNYADVDLPPAVLVFDEYVAFLSSLDWKEAENLLFYLKQITMLGRQVGYFLILACQRPDAKFLPDGIRDQFGLRLALGKMSESGYAMIFGEVDKTFKPKRVKGRGYADYGTGTISEFYSPFVPKGYDFLNEFKKSAEARGALATVVASGNESEVSEAVLEEGA